MIVPWLKVTRKMLSVSIKCSEIACGNKMRLFTSKKIVKTPWLGLEPRLQRKRKNKMADFGSEKSVPLKLY